MAKSRSKKEKELASIKALLERANVAIFTDYQGFAMPELKELRKRLAGENNAEYHITKNTLLKKALAEKNLGDLGDEMFSGPIATVFGFGDEIAPIKAVKKFITEKEKGGIRGGIFERKIASKEMILSLAALPSMAELHVKIIQSMNSPLHGLMNALSATTKKMVYALSAIKK